MFPLDSLLLRKIIDPARIWTWNPLIRSQMLYPLGHGATHSTIILLILKIRISWIAISSKTPIFFLIRLPGCYRAFCHKTVQ